MKKETTDALQTAVVGAAGIFASVTLQNVSLVVSIIAGLATFCWMIVQTLFLIRRWRLLEKDKWKSLNTNGDA